MILPVERPIKETGHLQILYGNLSPEGSVAKITGGWVGQLLPCIALLVGAVCVLCDGRKGSVAKITPGWVYVSMCLALTTTTLPPPLPARKEGLTGEHSSV